jgi:DNA-binding NarL/FixJ family response regulator
MNIVIIAQNRIFRESLKTVLNQIQDFDVVFDSDNFYKLENPGNHQIQLILIDFSMSKENCVNIITEAIRMWPSVRFLYLTDYKEEWTINGIKASDIILKNSSKKEFENKIRKQEIN